MILKLNNIQKCSDYMQTVYVDEADHMDKLYNSNNCLVKFVHRDRLKKITVQFSKLMKSEMSVLDAGCGEGHLLEELNKIAKNNRYFGIDANPIAIERAEKKCLFAEIKLGNLLDTKFESEMFDVIVCSEVIEHIVEYKLVLEELKRLLKHKGILIITFPNEFLWTVSRFILGRKPLRVPDHYNSFTPNKIKRLVGMKVLRQTGLPFGLPFVLSLGYLIVFEKE